MGTAAENAGPITALPSGEVGPCPGCAVALPTVEGPVHPYLTCSAACWATYGRVLAAQYADPERMRFHQVVVDAYAAQHPGTGGDPRAVRSVGIHLMTLCLFLDHGTDPARGTDLHRRMVGRRVFHELPASPDRGDLTCADIPVSGSADRARTAAFAWASAVW